jgi:hypothetical protein
MGGLSVVEKASPSRARRVFRLVETAAIVVIFSAVAWLAWASALGDRTTAMVVALSVTIASCAAFLSRLADGGKAAVVATAAFGATPAIALATLRALSEPLMGTAFTDGAARQREGIEAVIIAASLAAVCTVAAAVIARRRLEERRVSKWLVTFMTWSPLLVVPASLVFTLVDGYRSPSPGDYSVSQPVLAHMEPASADGPLLIDELERKEGVTLVRVCEDTPWCYTLLRRGDRVTTRPGHVARGAPVHLRYDPIHELYLVESNGVLVSTVNAQNLASYNRLLPHHVRGSLTPPRAYSLLAAGSLVGAIFILLLRRRLRRRRERATRADAGVCFGDGWGLLADGTTMRVPDETKRGSILVMWSHGRDATLTLLEGTREEVAKRFDERSQALDALQLAVMWTLCTPFLISAAVV